jgi:tRNA-specific 2-thiouridylase
MAKVIVGLSGGVDSSVAAYLLQQEGHEVIGLFMKNWHDDSVTISDECPWLEDSNDALIVAEHLGIPFQTIDLSEEYKQRIVDYMFAEYEKGRTPNPDVLCNREIKFDVFLKTALSLGADFVATGHYCRKETETIKGVETHKLLAGKDDNKDQSYFLCQLSQNQLAKALFPIGKLEKPQVRAIAKEAGLLTAEKKDSQGLCFIGKVRLPDFLQQKLSTKKGKVIEVSEKSTLFNRKKIEITQELTLDDLTKISKPFPFHLNTGKNIGEHNGAHYYTIGQRKGLGIGGTPLPLFVIGTDTQENLIFVGQGEDHPGLLRKGLFVLNEDVHWVRKDLEIKPNETARYKARIRYRQDLSDCTLFQKENKLFIIFDNEQRAVAPGQFIAWYDGDELIGSGVIS